MDLTIILRDFSQVFSEIYSTENEARMIAETAGLKTGNIDFSGSSIVRWSAILKQAHLQSALKRLMETASDGYENYEPLRNALQQFEQWQAQEQAQARPVQVEQRPLAEMNELQRLELAEALAKVPSMNRNPTRSNIVNALPATIRDSIPTIENATLLDNILNILTACQNHDEGVETFLRILRMFEKDSRPMGKVDEVAERIAHNG